MEVFFTRSNALIYQRLLDEHVVLWIRSAGTSARSCRDSMVASILPMKSARSSIGRLKSSLSGHLRAAACGRPLVRLSKRERVAPPFFWQQSPSDSQSSSATC